MKTGAITSAIRRGRDALRVCTLVGTRSCAIRRCTFIERELVYRFAYGLAVRARRQSIMGSAVNGAKIRSVWNGLLPRSRRGSRTQPRVSTRFQPWEPSNDVSLVSIIRRMGRHFQDTLLLLAGQPIRPVADPCAASSLIPAFRQHIVTIVALPSNARPDYVAWKLTSALNG